MKSSLPTFLKKFFWGDNLSELNWPQHQKYITTTLLEKGDEKAISWLLDKVNKNDLKTQLNSLKLSPKSNNFWQIYLS